MGTDRVVEQDKQTINKDKQPNAFQRLLKIMKSLKRSHARYLLRGGTSVLETGKGPVRGNL